jgi:hypothetical protein
MNTEAQQLLSRAQARGAARAARSPRPDYQAVKPIFARQVESHLLERIERAATAGPGAENVECITTSDRTLYVRRAPANTTLFAIACNFQPRYCSITLCGEVFEHAAPPIDRERKPSYRVETHATHYDLPTPQLVFGVLRYDEDQRLQGMLDMITSAVARAETPPDGAPALLITATELAAALAPARRALAGDSNDAEHDALYELAGTVEGWLDLAAEGTPTTGHVSDSRVLTATRLGELLLDTAERHGVEAAGRQAFIGALARSDLAGLVRGLVAQT